MSTKKTLIRNTFWLGLVEAFSKLILFGVTISLVRYLGPKDFGSFNLAFSYVTIFMILADFGLGTVTTREVAKHKDHSDKYLSNLLGLKISLSALIVVLIGLSFLVVPISTSKNMILAVMFYLLCQNIDNIFNSIFLAWERMELVFFSRIFYYSGLLISALAIIALKGTALQIVLAYGFFTFLSVLFSTFLIKKIGIKVAITFDKVFWKEILIESIPFMGLAIVGTVYANSDTLLIGHFWGNESVGFYQSAYKILFAFQSINVINNAIFPRINVLIHENKSETLNKLIKLVVLFSIFGLIPLALFITFFQNLIIKIIYGPVYLSAAPVMALLVWSGVINYFRILTSNILFAHKKQKYVFYSVSIGLVTSLLINLLIMPKFGFTVSAWSLLISETVILLATIVFLNKKTN
jgi:O-antigen/teichoic acid export membrane protein